MPYSNAEFTFNPNYNFAVEGVFVQKHSEQSAPFPPISGDFLLLDGTDFLLLDSTNFLLL